MKHLKINIPEGYEIDKAQSTFENIVFKPTVVSLPKKWEELKILSGAYVSTGVYIITAVEYDIRDFNKNIFATKEQAEASIALAQLSQLMQVYNDGWVPDWTDDNYKYNIEYYMNESIVETRSSYSAFLTFKTEKLAQLFLENFKDLITIAKPLL